MNASRISSSVTVDLKKGNKKKIKIKKQKSIKVDVLTRLFLKFNISWGRFLVVCKKRKETK